jgi:hypothetical protein
MCETTGGLISPVSPLGDHQQRMTEELEEITKKTQNLQILE